MDFLVKHLASEWHVIWQAPITFVIALLMAATLVYAILQWHYSGQIDDLKSRIKLRDDQLSDYIRKLDGASPDEAKARIDRLDTRIKDIAESPMELKGVLDQKQQSITIDKSPTRDSAQEREFLPDHITIEMIHKEVGNLTNVQAERLRQPYLHKWISVAGTVNDVHDHGGSMQLVLNDPNKSGFVAIYLTIEFDSSWHDRLSMLKTSESVQIIGKIDNFKFGSINLTYAEII